MTVPFISTSMAEALMLGLAAVMLVSRAEHRAGLGLGAAAVMLVLLFGLAALGKRRAARDPEFAAR